MSKPWTIDETCIEKKFRKLQSNAALLNQYDQFISDLKRTKHDEHPEHGGQLKTGRYPHLYGRHLTKSEGVLYRLDYESRIIILYGIGDHKDLFMKG